MTTVDLHDIIVRIECGLPFRPSHRDSLLKFLQEVYDCGGLDAIREDAHEDGYDEGYESAKDEEE